MASSQAISERSVLMALPATLPDGWQILIAAPHRPPFAEPHRAPGAVRTLRPQLRPNI